MPKQPPIPFTVRITFETSSESCTKTITGEASGERDLRQIHDYAHHWLLLTGRDGIDKIMFGIGRGRKTVMDQYFPLLIGIEMAITFRQVLKLEEFLEWGGWEGENAARRFSKWLKRNCGVNWRTLSAEIKASVDAGYRTPRLEEIIFGREWCQVEGTRVRRRWDYLPPHI